MTPFKTTVVSDKPRTPLFMKNTTSSDNEDDSVVRKLRKNFEDTTKKTFRNIGSGNNIVKKKIESYTQISRDNDNCLIGSGRCAKHNTRVQRVVKNKKVSVVSKDGFIGWKFCDVTELVCPAANSGASKVAVSNDNLSDERGGTTANKRARFVKNFETDQPDLSPAMM